MSTTNSLFIPPSLKRLRQRPLENRLEVRRKYCEHFTEIKLLLYYDCVCRLEARTSTCTTNKRSGIGIYQKRQTEHLPHSRSGTAFAPRCVDQGRLYTGDKCSPARITLLLLFILGLMLHNIRPTTILLLPARPHKICGSACSLPYYRSL